VVVLVVVLGLVAVVLVLLDVLGLVALVLLGLVAEVDFEDRSVLVDVADDGLFACPQAAEAKTRALVAANVGQARRKRSSVFMAAKVTSGRFQCHGSKNGSQCPPAA
jgi:hypothetical protein